MFQDDKKIQEMDNEEIIDLDAIDDLKEINLQENEPKAEKLNQRDIEKKEISWKREVLSTVIYLLVVVALTFLFIRFVAQRTHVNGTSMNPTLENGDNLIVDKLSYNFFDPERYDIIVFPYRYEENTYYIKRIIGMPGETVQILNGAIYIDGELLEENYGKETMENAGVAIDRITLGEDEYFVLGDNRNNSSDSRDPSVGNIKKDEIIGKAFIRIWPFDEFGILKHQ